MSGASSESLSSMKSKPPGEKWLFTEEQLQNTPSRRDNILASKELNYRQQAANLIQDMGQRLPVNQLTINTAIVYMHRFYMFHSFPSFSRFVIAPTALFLAAKVEEQPRKLEHVIRVCNQCLHPDKPSLDVHSDNYLKQAQQLVEHEIIMLQTLGFDISIDHPHTHVVKCTQLVKASRDLSQMAYFMATNSLHLTTFCLKYKPTVVSAMCIHLSCKWSNYEIPLSSEGKAYWSYMDPTITEAMLENIIAEFLQILNLCPTRLRKLKNYRPSSREGTGGSTPQHRDTHQQKPSTSKALSGGHQSNRSMEVRRSNEVANTTSDQQKRATSLTIAEYKHKREREQQQQSTNKHSNPSQTDTAAKAPLASKGFQHQSHVSSTQKPTGILPGTSRSIVKTEGQPIKHVEKTLSKPVNHRRPNKPTLPDGPKPHPVPGLHRSRHAHANSQPTFHHDREQSKMQSQSKQHQNAKLVPKQEQFAKVAENQSSQHNRSLTQKTSDPEDRILAGMEQKIMEQMNAEKTKEVPKLESLSFSKPEPSTSIQQSAGYSKEQKGRHSLPNMSPPKEVHNNPTQMQPLPKTYAGLYDLYKKNPDSLRHQLKQKGHITPLSVEERQILSKLRKKEEEKQQKRKRKEKHRATRTNPVEGATEGGNVTPGGGPLTVRIKLPQTVRVGVSKGEASGSASTASGLNPGSSSGSGSDAVAVTSPGGSVTKVGKKRAHTHDIAGSTAPVAKYPKKIEGHHHQSHITSQDSTKHKHKHSRSGSHHRHSKANQSSHKIDEATFQQALNDAVTMVQSGQTVGATGTERVVPTVTLKRTEAQNGSGERYTAQSSRQDKIKLTSRSRHLGFDPSVPISDTPPENLFDAEAAEHVKPDGITATNSADVSSPETGEIVDDDDDDDDRSPFGQNVHDFSTYASRPGLSQGGRVPSYHHSQNSSNSHKVRQHDPHKAYNSRMPNLINTSAKRNEPR